MEARELERALEEAFAETLLRGFIPGLLHNFANPLNGIMGRAKILERRLENLEAALGGRTAGMGEDWGKVQSDIRLLNAESERFAGLFQEVASRFGILSQERPERFDLAELVRREVRFADHYLDFKHRVRKVLDLADGLLPVQGVQAHFAMALWALLRHAADRMRGKTDHELRVTLSLSGGRVLLRVRHTGEPSGAEEREDAAFVLREGLPPRIRGNPHGAFCLSLLLLKHYGAVIDAERDGEVGISLPAG